jgi:hypothetical protein
MNDSPLSTKTNLFALEADGAHMPKAPIHPLPKLPGVLAERLAKLAKVPTNERDEFCRSVSDSVLRLWKRDRRAVSSKPGQALIQAAKAARTLQQTFFRLNKQDRDWVENIMHLEMQFMAGEIHHLESTIVNLAMVFSAAIGRPSPLPRHLERILPRGVPPKIKDQMFRELVFGLLGAAEETRGHFSFDKNPVSGTLARALDLLRDHLPKGLVPDPLHGATIQRLKTDFFRLTR